MKYFKENVNNSLFLEIKIILDGPYIEFEEGNIAVDYNIYMSENSPDYMRIRKWNRYD